MEQCSSPVPADIIINGHMMNSLDQVLWLCVNCTHTNFRGINFKDFADEIMHAQ